MATATGKNSEAISPETLAWLVHQMTLSGIEKDKDKELYTAAISGKVDEVRSLIGQNGDVNLRIKNVGIQGSSPLLLEVIRETRRDVKCLEVMRTLIGANADVNAKDRFGCPIVEIVVENRCKEALQIMLDSKVDLSGGKLDSALDVARTVGQWNKPEWAKDGPIMEAMLKGETRLEDFADKKEASSAKEVIIPIPKSDDQKKE